MGYHDTCDHEAAQPLLSNEDWITGLLDDTKAEAIARAEIRNCQNRFIERK